MVVVVPNGVEGCRGVGGGEFLRIFHGFGLLSSRYFIQPDLNCNAYADLVDLANIVIRYRRFVCCSQICELRCRYIVVEAAKVGLEISENSVPRKSSTKSLNPRLSFKIRLLAAKLLRLA